MDIYFTDHAIEKYEERLRNIDSGALEKLVKSGQLYRNDRLEREIRCRGVFYEMADGRHVCIIKNLKVYGINIQKDKMIVKTTFPCTTGLLAKAKRSERVNVPEIGKQNPKARTLEIVVKDQQKI